MFAWEKQTQFEQVVHMIHTHAVLEERFSLVSLVWLAKKERLTIEQSSLHLKAVTKDQPGPPSAKWRGH